MEHSICRMRILIVGVRTKIHGSFKKYLDWFYYKTTRSAAVFILLPVRSSYSLLSIDIISSVELNIYMKI